MAKAMMEKELAKFEGDGRFWFVPFVISLVLIGVAAENPVEELTITVFCAIFFIFTWKDLGQLVRAGSQRVSVTTSRIRGEVNHGVISGHAKTTFSVPYSEIVKTEREFFGYGLKITIAGASRKIRIVGIRDAHVLENFLASIVAIRSGGGDYDPDRDFVRSVRPWPDSYGDLRLALHDTEDLFTGDVPENDPEFAPVDLSPRDARVEFTGTWVKWLGGGAVALVVLAGAVLFGAYVVAVADAQERLGGDKICVTAARAYRDALPRAVRISLEKISRDPSEALGRAIVSQIAGSLLADAYTDDAFAAVSELQCGFQLAADYYGDGFIATQISDEIEDELKSMLK